MFIFICNSIRTKHYFIYYSQSVLVMPPLLGTQSLSVRSEQPPDSRDRGPWVVRCSYCPAYDDFNLFSLVFTWRVVVAA